MTMREIQDLTLHMERGLAEIETRFSKSADAFNENVLRFSRGKPAAFAVRATAQPLNALNVERVHGLDALLPSLTEIGITINQSKLRSALVIPEASSGKWRPIIRGSKSIYQSDFAKLIREIHCDGHIEYTHFVAPEMQPPLIFPGWVFCLVTNAMISIERFRVGAGAPNVEFAFDFEIFCPTSDLSIGFFDNSRWDRYRGSLSVGRHQFPRYSIGDRREFPSLVSLIERDFWNACGRDIVSAEIDVNFAEAFERLGVSAGL